MNDIQEKLELLQSKGWTVAAIADELGVGWSAVNRWRSGDRYPQNAKGVIALMDGMLHQKRVPKRRRYKGTHHLQRKNTV